MSEVLEARRPAGAPVAEDPVRLQHEVEQFLYREAELLDDRRIEDWVALMAQDVRYLMPIRTNRSDRELNLEYVPDGGLAYFDESKASLKFRLARLKSGQAWAESPPSRTRHLISNVRVEAGCDLSYAVKSAFMVYRSRLERQVDIYCGERQDILRRTQDAPGFEIARRTILLDQATVLAANFSIFF